MKKATRVGGRKLNNNYLLGRVALDHENRVEGRAR